MMRPDPATWFEIRAANCDGLRIAEALAAGGCTEFEMAGPRTTPSDAAEQGARLRARFEELERHYRGWWPRVAMQPPRASAVATLAGALERIEAWGAIAAPQIAAVLAAETELAALKWWEGILASLALGIDDRAALVRGGPLAAGLYLCARRAELRLSDGLLARPFKACGDACLFAVGAPVAMARLTEQVATLGGRRVETPEWIASPDAAGQLAVRRAHCSESAAAGRARLDVLAEEYRLAEAVAEARCACWCLETVGAVAEGAALCRVTGWTGDPTAVRRLLDGVGVPALLRFSMPPPGLQPPLLLHNPWWARPYEAFSRLLGMPERNAADPSALVALVFPLIFGYMFGDLGQGLLLAVAGLLIGGRWPLAKVFVPAGLSAAFFGLVFGSVFSLQGIVPALWHDPLDKPLPVLVLPLFGGASLLLVGLVLAGVEAGWRGQFAAWLRSEGGAMALYLALLLVVAVPAGVGLPPLFVALAAVATALALALWQGGGVAAVLSSLAASVENALQLAINTISFVRVGAFAIGHAGLSAALGLLADAAGEGAAAVAVVVVGNVVIIVLEVLVVSIQTTRLLLFEFFIRFFVGSGRAFRPAAPPAMDTTEALHEA
ncbi:V-type ATP synthase subunit I [Azoarcus sp. Aa7]|nr:V-type ATP synthase subunit I [Azoarcus sp. Aa7]